MQLPRDVNNNAIPVLSVKNTFTLDGTLAVANMTALETDSVIQITAETECRFRVGLLAVAVNDGTSSLLPKGSMREYFLPANERISVIAGKCNVNILR